MRSLDRPFRSSDIQDKLFQAVVGEPRGELVLPDRDTDGHRIPNRSSGVPDPVRTIGAEERLGHGARYAEHDPRDDHCWHCNLFRHRVLVYRI